MKAMMADLMLTLSSKGGLILAILAAFNGQA